ERQRPDRVSSRDTSTEAGVDVEADVRRARVELDVAADDLAVELVRARDRPAQGQARADIDAAALDAQLHRRRRVGNCYVVMLGWSPGIVDPIRARAKPEKQQLANSHACRQSNDCSRSQPAHPAGLPRRSLRILMVCLLQTRCYLL